MGIHDELRAMDLVPRSVRRKAAALDGVVKKLQNKWGRPPEYDEVAGEMGVSMDELFNMMNETKSMPILSLEDLGIANEAGEQQNLLDCIAGKGDTDPQTSLRLRELKETIANAIDTLPEKERLILDDPVTYIAKGELKRRMATVPYLDDSEIMGCLYQPNVGFFEPVSMAKEFVDRAKRHGAQVHEYSEINEIVKKGNEIDGLVVNGDFKEVEIIEVLVKPGDKIKKNDPIVTLESDKSSVEVPSPFEGKISELKVKIGDKVSEGSILATLEGGKVKEEEKPVKEEKKPVKEKKIEPQEILNEDRTNGQIVKREKVYAQAN